MQAQLFVRSTKARDLAHRLARIEGRTIAGVVERALEMYAHQHAGNETAENFFRRLSQIGTDGTNGPDLAEVFDEDRQPHQGPSL